MKRLTREVMIITRGKEAAACNYKNDDCNDYCRYGTCRWQEKANMLLKKYEDTGLTPEQIIKIYGQSRWIPVEERLPEGQTRVICQFDNGDIELLWQDWESDPETLTYLADFSMMAEKKVIAWRPLPDLYQAEKIN